MAPLLRERFQEGFVKMQFEPRNGGGEGSKLFEYVGEEWSRKMPKAAEHPRQGHG